MPDQGRFMLDGAHFSWWLSDRSVLILHSLRFGDEELRLEGRENPEVAARRLAKRILHDAQNLQ